jgi:2'-5' RNA ligase
MLRFLVKADNITDIASAERVLSKYKNEDVHMRVDAQSFDATLIDARVASGILHIKFSWKTNGSNSNLTDIASKVRLLESSIGKMVRFQVNSDSFMGLLTNTTKPPTGFTPDQYVDSPFVISFSFNEQDQTVTAGAGESSIIGLSIPKNIQDMLPFDPELEYPPHITVCYFPKLEANKLEAVVDKVREVSENFGSFKVTLDGKTTSFPNPGDDGKYPYVALVNCPMLQKFHSTLVEALEDSFPGLVDTKFAYKNYKPHATLSYVEEPLRAPIKPVAWTVDKLYLHYKSTDKIPITLQKKHVAKTEGEVPYIQFENSRIPITIAESDQNKIVFRLSNSSDAPKAAKLEGMEVMLGTRDGDRRIEIMDLDENGNNEYTATFRVLNTHVPITTASTLRYVAAVAESRGLLGVAEKIAKFLDFSTPAPTEECGDEGEDKEALGPGFEGTDPRIVTYVKSPQTQQSVEEPKNPKSLPLHERI